MTSPGPYQPIQWNDVVLVDTETTGLHAYPADGEPDRICSAAFLHAVRGADGWRMVDRLVRLFNPDRPIAEAAAKVNGYWWGSGPRLLAEMVSLDLERPFSEQAEDILAFIGDRPIVCHNVNFDVAFLDAELERMGRPPLGNETICTKKAFADLKGLGRPDHYIPGTNLNTLAEFCGISNKQRFGVDGVELHGAEIDAELMAGCFARLDRDGWLLAEPAASLPHRRGRLPQPELAEALRG